MKTTRMIAFIAAILITASLFGALAEGFTSEQRIHAATADQAAAASGAPKSAAHRSSRSSDSRRAHDRAKIFFARAPTRPTIDIKGNHCPSRTIARLSPERSSGWGIAICWRGQSMLHPVRQLGLLRGLRPRVTGSRKSDHRPARISAAAARRARCGRACRLNCSDTHANRLGLEVILEDLAAHLAAPARLLVAAKGHRGVEDVVAIDPDRTSP